MMKEKMINKLIEYYKNPENIRRIIPYLQQRELALIVSKGYVGENNRSTRNIRIRNERDWQWWVIKWSGMIDKGTHYNFYHSLAKFKNGFPDFPAKHKERQEALKTWNKYYWDNISSYDCLIDIDSPNHSQIELAKQSAIMIMEYLEEQGIQHEIRFSGCGFHFIIPDDQFKSKEYHPMKPKNIYQEMRELVYYLYDHFSEYVDTTVIDSKRVCKIPNTVAIYHHKTYICTVLSRNGLINFKLSDYEWQKK